VARTTTASSSVTYDGDVLAVSIPRTEASVRLYVPDEYFDGFG